MRNSLCFVGIFLVASLRAAPLPPAAPIVTDAELRTAASNVLIARIDFAVPDKKSAAEDALAKRFFNQPEEHRYSGMTNVDWIAKWQLFSQALVTKAKAQGFDSSSLEACLRALNRGRNQQTMFRPDQVEELFPPGTPNEKIEASKKKAEEKLQLALKDREKHPERWYEDSDAIVPVAAYLARHAKGECWIIVCKWEITSKDEALPLGHIKVWALDTKSASVVGYVTCD
jgi:hypothetical protein